MPNLPDDFDTWKREVERFMVEVTRALASRPPLNKVEQGDFTVSNGGGIIIDGLGRIDVKNGGSVLVRDRQGRDVFYAGGFAGEGFGIAAYRLDGSIAFIVSDDDAAQELVQRYKLFDRNGRTILAEDPSGDGIAWPPPPLTFQGVSWPTWDGNNTSSFVTIAKCTEYKRTPRFALSALHIGESGTTGEIRLLANGVQVGPVVPVAALTMGGTGFGTPAALPGDTGSPVTLELQARRTAGTGMVRGRVEWAFGWGS